MPLNLWFKKHKTARIMFEDYVSSNKIKGIFNIEEVNAVVKEHDRGRDNSRIMWYLLVLFIWFYKSEKTVT